LHQKQRVQNSIGTKSYIHAHNSHIHQKSSKSLLKRILDEIKKHPIQYATVPAIAAFVGISTNYMGVQMLFYPIEYIGTTGSFSHRIQEKNLAAAAATDDNGNDNDETLPNKNDTSENFAPYGIFGWQGVVPARTEKMALRLVDIVTKQLLKLKEAFGRIDHVTFANMMVDPVREAVERDCGKYWALILKPFLPLVLRKVVKELQNDIEDVLDLEQLVLNAFVRDKIVLVDLFQKVGRVELDFLVKSGFGFGFLLGLGQMALWAVLPVPITLPIAGALVGYVTNWIAIKLLFEPVEPIDIGPFVLQGLFGSRQPEVSDEFAHFLESRVLSSPMLLDALTNQNKKEMYDFLRKQLPWPIPEHVILAAMEAIQTVARNPQEYDNIHKYVSKSLDIEDTLSSRLKMLSPKSFENLLHPVFQEDEIILIVVGGVLGAMAGVLQTRLGWGGPNARFKSAVMLVSSLVASGFFYFITDLEESLKDVINEYVEVDEVKNKEIKQDGLDLGTYESAIDQVSPILRRKNSLLRTKA